MKKNTEDVIFAAGVALLAILVIANIGLVSGAAVDTAMIDTARHHHEAY